MKSLVVYESFFGNTKIVAEKIGAILGARLVQAKDFKRTDLSGVDLLVVGSATRAFRPSPDTAQLLKQLAPGSLQNIKVAAFDTRINPKDIKSPAGRVILGAMSSIFGYAAKPIANSLTKAGGQLIAEPEGFYVLDTKGPLGKLEIERATKFAEQISSKKQ